MSIEKAFGVELSQVLKETTKILVERAVQNEPPNPLALQSQKITQLIEDSNIAFEKLSNDFLEAAAGIREVLEVLSRTRSDINLEQITQELQALRDMVSPETLDALAIQDDENFDPQEIIKLSPETLKAMFEASAYLLSEKRFLESMKAFLLLTTIAPRSYDSWIGLGHSAFHNKRFDIAVLGYYRASSLRGNNPWPLIWAANASESQGEKEAAVDLLAGAMELAKVSSDKEMAILVKELETRMSELKNKK